MKTKNKLIILALAFIICISIMLIPNQTQATEEINVTEVASLAQLKQALQDALDDNNKTAQIKLTEDIELTETIKIQEDVIINGNNKTITATVRKAFELQTGKVEFSNITIINSAATGRCIDIRDGDVELSLTEVTLQTTGTSAYNQTLNVGGNFSNPITIILNKTKILTENPGYGITTFNPVNLTINNSEIVGYAALYLKGEDSSQGSAGSTVNINNSTLTGINANKTGDSNTFGTIIFEDHDMELNINNSNLIAQTAGISQVIIGENKDLENSDKPNKVTISGNTVITACNEIVSLQNENAKVTLKEGVISNREIPQELLPTGAEVRLENDGYIVYESHDIIIEDVKNGVVTVDKTSALDGENITITANANEGYQLKSLKAFTAAETEINIVDGKFVMPNLGVIITAEFEKIPYAIKIEESTNGKVTAVENAVEGEKVKLTVTPDMDYELSKLTVLNVDNKEIEVVAGEFVMPAGGVTVKAQFTKIIPPMDYIISGNETENNNLGVVESEKTVETLDTSLKADTELNKKVEEERQKGNQVTIEITMEELNEEIVKEEEKQKILETVEENQTVHQYFDISVLVRTQEAELGKLTQLTEKMKFTMEISKDLIQEGRRFYILKLHGDKVEKIEATLKGTKLEFETDQFSTFALAYEDAKTVEDEEEDNSGEVPGGAIEEPKDEVKEETKEESKEEINVPNTGDNIVLYIALALIAVIGMVVTKKVNARKK